MRGLMMDRPLLISSLLTHAERHHGTTEIVSRSVEGPIHRTDWAGIAGRARRLAQALTRLGVRPGDRIGTLAWNGYRHLEIYYGVSGLGAVCHTVNPRLFPQQIAYIVNHAEDRYLFADLTFMPLLEALADHLTGLAGVVVMTDRAHMPAASKLPNLLCYEELLAAEDGAFDWPDFDENTAASLCYTSGTTGNPKGVLYSHRSTVLHSFSIALPDVMALSAADCVMPVVPMFHVNAWGLPYAGAMVGCKIVFPGAKMDGASLFELIESERVTMTAGVPTIWLALLTHLRGIGRKLDGVKTVVIGGAAAPAAMIEAFEREHGVDVLHAWGMTELSPLGTANRPKGTNAALPPDEALALKAKQGRPVYGVEMRITGDGGDLPHDGRAFGDLKVRGPWVCSAYFKEEGSASHDSEGWFSTGDVATIDPDGYMQITDRSKDVIKSGGEWISSIELENTAVGHPEVAEAAAIGIKHPKWDERPLLIVVRRPGSELDKAGLLAFFEGRIAKWWMPDDIVFVDELPHTATGKLLKTKLREQFRDYTLPTA
ncbi:MAG TPA: 3-(methylthio)propionyl-CoA ligase [Alphaproteobacteria bacterium]|nr:3-(methylthio)propionyl-CoA ligase [Alphaproteobacteria bacterium]